MLHELQPPSARVRQRFWNIGGVLVIMAIRWTADERQERQPLFLVLMDCVLVD
jgi:hypothetical protein